MQEACVAFICFSPPAGVHHPIFRFAEFLTAVALLAVFYTATDFRYRFRISVALGSQDRATFTLVGIICLLSLVSDVWTAQQWWLPLTAFVTVPILQGYFGLLFLFGVLSSMFAAFVVPPVFGRSNCERYVRGVHSLLVRGNSIEVATLADELGRSADTVVQLATSLASLRQRRGLDGAEPSPPPRLAEQRANELLSLIADRRLARQIVAASPSTLLAFVAAMRRQRRVPAAIGDFVVVVAAEAFANKDSSVFHENRKHAAGLLGVAKPWTQALYSDFELVEALASKFGSPLDIPYKDVERWDAQQWGAYCQATLVTTKSCIDSGRSATDSYVVARALRMMPHALVGFADLNGRRRIFAEEAFIRLRLVTDFIGEAVEYADKNEKSQELASLGQRRQSSVIDLYEALADLAFEVLQVAARITEPPDTAYDIHFNTVWRVFFSSLRSSNQVWRMFEGRLRRLIYDQVVQLGDGRINYPSARLLGLVLNVLGVSDPDRLKKADRRDWPLAKAVITWTQDNYLRIRRLQPEMGQAVLSGGITFDEKQRSLIKTYGRGASGLASQAFMRLKPENGAGAE